MFDYLSLTQKGYSKAFDPVNELLTQLLQEMEGEVGRTEAEGSADWVLHSKIFFPHHFKHTDYLPILSALSS